jgi:hypothetical protein
MDRVPGGIEHPERLRSHALEQALDGAERARLLEIPAVVDIGRPDATPLGEARVEVRATSPSLRRGERQQEPCGIEVRAMDDTRPEPLEDGIEAWIGRRGRVAGGSAEPQRE